MEILKLEHGQLFTLPCENNRTIYAYEGVVCEGGEPTGPVDYCLIRAVAGYWPAGARGEGEPAQWVATKGAQQQHCNPYATVRLVEIPAPVDVC